MLSSNRMNFHYHRIPIKEATMMWGVDGKLHTCTVYPEDFLFDSDAENILQFHYGDVGAEEKYRAHCHACSDCQIAVIQQGVDRYGNTIYYAIGCQLPDGTISPMVVCGNVGIGTENRTFRCVLDGEGR